MIVKLLIVQPYFFHDDRVLQYPPIQVEPSSVNDFFLFIVPYCKLFLPFLIDKWYYDASIKVSSFKFMSMLESYKGLFFYGHGHLPASILINAVFYLPNIGGIRSYEGKYTLS